MALDAGRDVNPESRETRVRFRNRMIGGSNSSPALRQVLSSFHDKRVSTRQIRTLHDFARHRRDIEVTCYCGHKSVLPFHPVIERFSRENWPIGLGSAAAHFRCSECGSSPAYIGPMER